MEKPRGEGEGHWGLEHGAPLGLFWGIQDGTGGTPLHSVGSPPPAPSQSWKDGQDQLSDRGGSARSPLLPRCLRLFPQGLLGLPCAQTLLAYTAGRVSAAGGLGGGQSRQPQHTGSPGLAWHSQPLREGTGAARV